jgi:hypothetical protein
VPYQETLLGWHDFYMVAGASSATLVGLLFVSLSLHLRAVLARREVRGFARVTLTNFAVVLLVALFVVIPQDSHGTGIDLQVAGAVSIVIVALPVLAARTSSTRTLSTPLLVLRFTFSILGYAGTLAAGTLLSNGSYTSGFSLLAAVTIVLLVISLRNSWDLLISVGEATATYAVDRSDAHAAQIE